MPINGNSKEHGEGDRRNNFELCAPTKVEIFLTFMGPTSEWCAPTMLVPNNCRGAQLATIGKSRSIGGYEALLLSTILNDSKTDDYKVRVILYYMKIKYRLPLERMACIT